MNKTFIVANWKSNKTNAESNVWINSIDYLSSEDKEVIVCPSFTSLSVFKYNITNNKSKIKIGAQNISQFDEGAYTGEVAGRQIKELADYVIVGHSERRENFHEDEGTIIKKLEIAGKYQLTPILCISDISQIQNSKIKALKKTTIVAYEPIAAIGSGIPDSPENANEMGKKIKELLEETPVLYGGSVTSENVGQFTKMPNINGVLVGGASLDPQTFAEIIKNA